MTTQKCLLILFLFSVQNCFAQNNVNEIKKCINGYTYISDLDGDKVAEKLCLKKWIKKHDNENVYDVILDLSSKKLCVKLSITKDNSTAEEYYETFSFKSQKNSKYKKIKNKNGLRIGFSEKSSRIYYWNFKFQKLIEIEESD